MFQEKKVVTVIRSFLLRLSFFFCFDYFHRQDWALGKGYYIKLTEFALTVTTAYHSQDSVYKEISDLSEVFPVLVKVNKG